MAAKNVTVPVDIELNHSQAKFLVEQTGLPVGQAIAGLAQTAMEDLAEGGFVVNGNVADQIRNLVGDIQEQQDLIRYIETALGMEDGSVVGKWRPDPTYVPVLEEIATSQGVTVSQCVQNLIDWGVSQNWGYSINPDTQVMFFTRDDFRAICEAFDKSHVTGTELAAFIRELYEQKQAEVPAPEVKEVEQT
jgi:hypothetical protein